MPETPAELIRQFVALRDERKDKDEQFAALRKECFDEPMRKIQMALLDKLNEMGSDSIKTKQGTAYKKTAVSVTTADGGAFQRHVIGLEAWDLIDFRPNKTAVNQLIADGEELPPGLNRTTFINVHVNSPKDKEQGND